MRRLAIVAILLIAIPVFAGTRDNDDTCDIKVGPAATLLLPYFEVDVSGNSGQTTLFTVTNVARYPQVARVTLWTDYAFPLLTFNLYLTGYDVQAINLADVLKPGIVASTTGTSSTTTPGSLSSSTSPNLITPLNCTNNPGVIPASIISAVRRALTVGDFAPEGSSACNGVGGVHANAIGYATIDVVSNCTPRSPADPLYYTNDILFDNVLIGDYQQLGPHPQGEIAGTFDGGGNPMVHIRAVPEGGAAGHRADRSAVHVLRSLHAGHCANARSAAAVAVHVCRAIHSGRTGRVPNESQHLAGVDWKRHVCEASV
jgi:hypothetical protein